MIGTPTIDASTEFLQQVIEATPDGERIKLCLQCGACSGACPFGYLMKFPPHGMIAALRAGMFEDLMDADTAWMCVSCYACTQVCPVKIPVTAGLTTQVKEEMILAGNVPPELQDALVKAERYKNPMGESPRKRAEWAIGLEPKVALMAKTNRKVDVLWFVGDYASYHIRVMPSARAMAKILNTLDVDFGILGPEEVSDGDSLRLAGEIGLFEMLAEMNAQALQKYQFNEIITTDPHAFNALKNEYPNLEISFPVRHYTQFLAERLDQIGALMKNSIEATITYHDACYLGRVNGVYEEPRQLLQAIPGVELVEMSHHRENSLCCGGGGGGMWLDGFQWEKAKVRISEWRVREAVSAVGEKGNGAENGRAHILAVACPYEAPRFDDATKTVPGAGGLIVKDIAELLAEAMGLEE
ncbi:MAG: 4Fe-4S dicluster domain-containing protein [Anaerolineales bacterium]|nr:4Fe-4S dicluster domain-containing protein [Anaerolineales bacterium]